MHFLSWWFMREQLAAWGLSCWHTLYSLKVWVPEGFGAKFGACFKIKQNVNGNLKQVIVFPGVMVSWRTASPAELSEHRRLQSSGALGYICKSPAAKTGIELLAHHLGRWYQMRLSLQKGNRRVQSTQMSATQKWKTTQQRRMRCSESPFILSGGSL